MFYINNMTQMSCNFREQSKKIAVVKMSQTKPHASVPLPHSPSQMASIFRGFSTW